MGQYNDCDESRWHQCQRILFTYFLSWCVLKKEIKATYPKLEIFTLALGQIFLFKISRQSSQFYLAPEKLTKLSKFATLQVFNCYDLKLNCAKKVICHLSLGNLARLVFCEIAQLFCVPFSLVRGKSESIERKFKTEKSSPNGNITST